MIDYFDKKRYNVPVKLMKVGNKTLDRITNSLMKKFSEEFELGINDEATLFEYFTNYCAATNENGTDNICIEDLTTGNSAQGIDGIAIVINGRFVYSIEDIDELIRLNRTIKVRFILCQSKTSDSFDNKEMSNFFTFSRFFFDGDGSIFATNEMQKFLELKNYIFDNAEKLDKNPELVLYYFTTGVWQGDPNLQLVIDDCVNTMKGLNLFSKVLVKPCGAEHIQELYRKTFNELTTTFTFDKKVVMYSLSEDEIGYCGVIPFREFSKIILDESGALKPVFEDNIRDFLGGNIDVNHSIEESIFSGNINAFSQLNNGVMIVANSLNQSGDLMTIRDYQIVNGCQTSHMLYEHIDDAPDLDNLMIPIRIISTKDDELKNRITRATNNQTAIKKEQLEALSTFQKNLEEYYKTYTNPNEVLYYERRSGQYRNSSIIKSRIVTIPVQIKTVTAMFLDNPHGVSGQYGTIARNVGNRIFKNTDKPIIYYTSALALYRVESLLKNGSIDKKFWKTRYHAMMLLRLIVSGSDMPNFNARKMETYCNKILDVLNDDAKCLSYFDGIISFIANEADLDLTDRKTFEKKESTDVLLSKLDEIRKYLEENYFTQMTIDNP